MIRNGAKRVLVVDDEPSIREMLSDFLEMNNFISMQADNGESAVDASLREKFDLIIMDVRMPGVSGIEALREIKRQTPTQPVQMVTAVSEVETAVEAMRLGANDYVMKPFVLNDMLVTVDLAIKSGSGLVAPTRDVDMDTPLTIAVGVPLDDQSDYGRVSVDREELDLLAADIAAIEEQLVALGTRFEALSQPRLRSLPRLTSVVRPGGGSAA
jgi:DNA-binding response OmpR family regulator